MVRNRQVTIPPTRLTASHLPLHKGAVSEADLGIVDPKDSYNPCKKKSCRYIAAAFFTY